MIIEIALGIVLALLITTFLPEIVAIGLALSILILVLIGATITLYLFFPQNSEKLATLLFIAFIIATIFAHQHIEKNGIPQRLKRPLKILMTIYKPTILVIVFSIGASYLYWSLSLPEEEIFFKWIFPLLLTPLILVFYTIIERRRKKP